ncbi:MAG TPA: tetratricopeptide repeat protein [Rhizobacter sp.]|nr:tetratricopeptide repeat protein [Rhizobacter sp.]
MSLATLGLMTVSVCVRADDYSEVDRLLAAGQLAEASQKADQYLASHPRDAKMRFLKGLVLSEQSRSTDAIAVFVKLTEDFPDLPEPYNNLAVLYGKQGQYDQARRALESAIRTNPSYATAYENLGDVYAKLASQAYSKALQIDGGNSKLTPKLAMIRELFAPQGKALASTSQKAPTGVAAAPAAAPAPKPAVAAPAKTVAPPVVVAAVPASAVEPGVQPATAAGSTADSMAVQAAANAWANAWSRKDMNAYFAAYAGSYSAGKSRKTWERERTARITGKRNISVLLSDVDVKFRGDTAVVQFRQSYAADALKVSSRKTLEMVRVSGQWLIQKESTGS